MSIQAVPAESSKVIYLVERAPEKKSELSPTEAKICRIAGYCLAAVGAAILIAASISTLGAVAGATALAFAFSESFFIWGIMAMLGGFHLAQAKAKPEMKAEFSLGPLSVTA